MTETQVIHEEIMLAPTILGVDLEQSFCERLRQLSVPELEAEWPLIAQIFDRLLESHSDSIYELRSPGEFSEFVSWARDLAQLPQFALHAPGLLGVADMFEIFPA